MLLCGFVAISRIAVFLLIGKCLTVWPRATAVAAGGMVCQRDRRACAPCSADKDSREDQVG
ncbi:hypothetical protein BLN97_02380 [Bradyrhizobium elkanii]|nr:hypothetical protein BLN97_02380 [Bradyrhizobium elkanii]